MKICTTVEQMMTKQKWLIVTKDYWNPLGVFSNREKISVMFRSERDRNNVWYYKDDIKREKIHYK